MKRRDVERALKTKGFSQESGDHDYYRLYVGGKKTAIQTKVSRGTKHRDLGDQNVMRMAHQMHLRIPQFRRFVDCRISEDEYVAVLRENGTPY